MKTFLLSAMTNALYFTARQLAGEMMPRIQLLVQDAQEQFGKGTGKEKKEWALERLQAEASFFGSALSRLPGVWLSAVFDVLVAGIKTREQ